MWPSLRTLLSAPARYGGSRIQGHARVCAVPDEACRPAGAVAVAADRRSARLVWSVSSARSSSDSKQQQLHDWQQQRQQQRQAQVASSRPSGSETTGGGAPRAPVRAGVNIGGRPAPGAVGARAGPKEACWRGGIGSGGNHGGNRVAAAAGFTFSAAATSVTAKMAAAVARTALSAKPRTLIKDVKAAATEGAVSGVGARKARFGFGLGGKAAPASKEKEEEAKVARSSQVAAAGMGQGGAKRVAADSKVASGKQMVASKGSALAKEKVAPASTSPLAAALRVAANHSKLLGLSSKIPAGVGKLSEKPAGKAAQGSGPGAKMEATQGRAGPHKTQQAHAGPSQAKAEVGCHPSGESRERPITEEKHPYQLAHEQQLAEALPRVEKKAGSGSPWIPGGVAQPSAVATADAAFSAMSTPRSSDAGQQLSREREGQHQGQHQADKDGQAEQQGQDAQQGAVVMAAFAMLDMKGVSVRRRQAVM
ncbi:hypothetical protein CLOP_g9182 [Closterium sp. NIES-67]|nr:hypothetical protein CLOP_g9182 [Closterium sp. NIES-67]